MRVTLDPNFDPTSPWQPDSMWSESEWPQRGGTQGWAPRVRLADGALTSVYQANLYSKSFIDRLTGEREWTSESELSPLSSAQLKAIGLGKAACPRHNPETNYVTSYYVGKSSGITVCENVRCVCHQATNFWKHWAKVPQLYRDVSYNTLSPISSPDVLLSLGRQKEIIDLVKSAPDDNYLLYGNSRTGKTHISYALHRRALSAWAKATMTTELLYQPILRAQVTTLLDQHLAAKTYDKNNPNGDPRPKVSIDVPMIEKIIADGSRPIIILDELDKLGNPTEFRMTTLHAIFQAVSDERGQIIATSNRSPQWMINAWGKDIAEPIIYRCGGGDRGKAIYFAENSKAPSA